MRKLILSDGEFSPASIKELREKLGQIEAGFEELKKSFNERKSKRDAGEDAPLWADGEEARFNGLKADKEIVQARIAEEETALQLEASRAMARGSDRQTRPASRDTADGRIEVPYRFRRQAERSVFQGPDAARDAYEAGQWVLGVLCGRQDAMQWCRDHLPEEHRAMAVGGFGTGGALVPDAFRDTIIDLVEQYGVAAAECEIVQMAADVVNWPRVTGGVTLYAIGEADTPTESTPSFDGIGLVARKWGALVKYSSELNESAVISIADFLARKVAEAWAYKLDQCVFLGDGTSTYHGIVGLKNALQDGSEYTAITGNTAFSTLDMADFESMIGKLRTWAERNAKWYISKAGWAASMMRLADAAGGNTVDHVAGGPSVRTFLGYPVVHTQVMNSTLTAQTSTEGLCYLGDLRGGVVLGMRRDIRMRTLGELYAASDQIGFTAFVRHDVNVHDVGTSTVAGGIIGLETPGS